MPNELDTTKFDLTTALPVQEGKQGYAKRPEFDLTSARTVADIGGKTPFEVFQSEGAGEFSQDVSKPISYGHAEWIQNKTKDPWYSGIRSGWEALRRPIAEGIVGFASRPFGKNLDTSTGKVVTGENPDPAMPGLMHEHPVLGTAGKLIGGFAPFIVAAPFIPETLIGAFAVNAGIGAVNAAGNIGMRNATESLFDKNPDKMAQMGKDASSIAKEGALWGTIGAWAKAVGGMKIAADSVKPGALAFETFMQKSYAAFQKSAVIGVGTAGASNISGYSLEDSFKNGGFMFAMHNIASVPANAKTAMGRGILNGLARKLNEAYEAGDLKVEGKTSEGIAAGKAKEPFTVDVDKWDEQMTRTKVTDMLRAIYQLSKPRLDKAAAGDPIYNPETGTMTPWLESPWARTVSNPSFEVAPEPPKGPMFYSRMVEVIKDKMPNQAAPDQVMGILKSAGISPDEVGLSGIEDHLRGVTEKVKKDDLIAFLQENQAQVGETIKIHDDKSGMYQVRRFVDGQDMGPVVTDQIFNNSVAAQAQADKFASMNKPTWRGMQIEYRAVMKDDTKYHGEKTTIPGGENYREILQTVPSSKNAQERFSVKQLSKNEFIVEKNLPGDHADTEVGPVHKTEAEAKAYLAQLQSKPADYRSSHWEQPNVLAHMRVDDRVSGNGDKVLFVQEAQSDWNRELKAGKTKADHPLVKKWQDLILKRALRLAAEEGHEYVAFISGKQTADRYDLSKQVDNVYVKKDVFGLYDLKVQPKNAPMMTNRKVHEKDLADFVGKDLAEKIIKDLNEMPTDVQSYSGLDLKIGGEWAANLYDQMIPAWLEKYGKRFGAKPEYINVPFPGDPDNMQLAMRITPALRSFLLEKGNPLFGTPQQSKTGMMYEQQAQGGMQAQDKKAVNEADINKDAPYEWTGISDLKIVDEKISARVPEAFKAYSKSSDITPEQEQIIKQYMAEALAGLDTDMIYDDLTLVIDSISKFEMQALKENGINAHRVNGYFEPRNLALKIAKDSKHTAAHEVGHYLDNKWAREIGMADKNLSTSEIKIADTNIEHMQWVDQFKAFVNDLVGKSADGNEYVQDPAEVFARFVARFVDWTRAQAGKKGFYEAYYSDNFTDSDYLQFIRLLQEKAAINKQFNIKPKVDNKGSKVSYEQSPEAEKQLANIESEIRKVRKQSDKEYEKKWQLGMTDDEIDAIRKPFRDRIDELEAEREKVLQELGREGEPMQMFTDAEQELVARELNREFKELKNTIKDYMKGLLPADFKDKGEYADLALLPWMFSKVKSSESQDPNKGPDRYFKELSDITGLQIESEDDLIDVLKTYFKDELTEKAKVEATNAIMGQPMKYHSDINKVFKNDAKRLAKAMKLRERAAAKILKRVTKVLSDTLNPSDYKRIIKETTGMTPEQRESMTYRQLMRDRVKVSKEAFKAGRSDVFNTIVKDLKIQKANTVQIKKDIADYAKSFLPQGIRAKAIPMIVNADSQDDLIKAFVRINRMAEDYEKKVMIAEVKDILSEIKDAKNIAIKEIEKAEELVKGLDFVNRKDDTIERIEKMKAAIEKAQAKGEPIEVTSGMVKELAILEKNSIKDMSIRDIQAIKAQLEILRDLGKKKLKSRQNIRQLRKEIIAEKVLSGIQNIDSVDIPERKAGEKLSNFEWIRRYVMQQQKGLQRIDLALTQMDVFFDLLDGGKGTFDGPAFKHFKSTTDLNYQAYMGIKDANQTPLMDLAKDLDLNVYNFERIGVYAAAQQENGLEKLAGMGYTQEEVEAYVLTEKEMQWYNAARQAFDTLHPVIEKFMNEEFNQELGKVNNYFSFMTDFDAMDDAEVSARFAEQSEFSRAKKTPEKGFTKARVGGGQKIQLNAYKIAMRHLDNVAYLLAMTHDNRVLFEIANSPEFREKAGEMGTSFTIDWLDTIARKGGAEGQKRIDWLDTLRRNIGVATLGFKDTTILIQTSALLDAGAYIGNYAFKGMADILDPEWAEFVMQMPEIRYREGDDPAFTEMDPSKVAPMFAWYAEFQKKGMLPIQKLDLVVAMATAAGAYQKYMNERGLPIDLSSPNPQAMEYAQRMVRRSQGSSFFKDAPQAGVRGKITGNRSVDKSLLQFSNFMISVRWNTIRNEIWRNGIRGGDYKDALAKSAWLMLSAIYGIGIMYGLTKLKDMLTGADTKFDIGKKLTAEAFNQVPLIGTLMGEVASGQQPGLPSPVLDTLVQTSKDIGYMVSSKKQDAKNRATVRTAMDLARLRGVPGTAMASNIVNRAMKPKKRGLNIKLNKVNINRPKIKVNKIQIQ